jgi:phosphate transport system protein
MERSFDQEFSALKELILEMGSRVVDAVDASIAGLVSRNPVQLKRVFEIEELINSAHMKVDDTCIKLIARQSPLAGDLRLVFSVVKINADLERMGDQAVNIAYQSEDYLKVAPIKPMIDLSKMTEEVRSMIRDSLASFVNQDTHLARKVLRQDDAVDAYKDTIIQELCTLMKADSSLVDPALNLIFIARNLERLGDHATNIAEEAIFDVFGTDVRHRGSNG